MAVGSGVNGDLIFRTLRHVPGGRLTYLLNPKVACSTINKSLWLDSDAKRGTSTFSGHPHDTATSPFCRTTRVIHEYRHAIAASVVFSVVRNPFTRLLSAYLDKIADKPDRDPHVWLPFSQRFQLGGRTPDFPEFVALIAAASPSDLDHHFAPQSIGLLPRLISADFIGQLERINETIAFLRDHGIEISAHSPHQTHAVEKLRNYYSPSEIGIVKKLFAADFEIYGYATEISVVDPIRNPVISPVDRQVFVGAMEALCRAQGAPELDGQAFDSPRIAVIPEAVVNEARRRSA